MVKSKKGFRFRSLRCSHPATMSAGSLPVINLNIDYDAEKGELATVYARRRVNNSSQRQYAGSCPGSRGS